jgi:hypothetical protein
VAARRARLGKSASNSARAAWVAGGTGVRGDVALQGPLVLRIDQDRGGHLLGSQPKLDGLLRSGLLDDELEEGGGVGGGNTGGGLGRWRC